VAAADGGCVIRQAGQGEFPEVIHLVRHVGSRYEGRLLEVAVGQVAVGVVIGDHACLDVGGEGHTPEEGGFPVAEEDATHSCLGRVYCLEDCGFFADDLGDASGPCAEVAR
jgi:hypothetical protein